MATIPIIQPSFAAGELSPFLYGRVDLSKFHVGARTMLNFFVHPHGGASNRPGTRFVGAVDDSTQRHRLIPFQFRASPSGQNYALVFGHLTLQVVLFNAQTGAPGFVLNQNGSLFTLATPYAASDLPLLKYVQSADTMTITHPRYAARQLRRSAHNAWTLAPITFAPTTPPPTGLHSAGGGTGVAVVVTAINDASGEESLPSASAASSSSSDSWGWNPVAGCSNFNVYKQKGSIFGFVAQVQTTFWMDANIAPDIGNTPPGSRNPFGVGVFGGLVINSGGSGYAAPSGALIDNGATVTAISLGVSGGAITSATPSVTGQPIGANAFVQITDGTGSGAVLEPQWTDDGSETGSSFISGVTVVNGGSGYHANCQVHSHYAGIVDYGGYRFTPTVSGGAIVAVAVTIGFGAWDATAQPLLTLAATDSMGTGAVITPTLNVEGGTNNPSCTTYYQQRQVFANSTTLPQTLWFSNTGAFNNMNVSEPTKDTDAITRALSGRQVNEIRHLVECGNSLLIMTSGAEWRCWPGPSSNALTPGSCFTLPQTTHGCNQLAPIWTENALLFVKERGNKVIELRFDVLQDQWQASDKSILSQHLVYDTTGQFQIQEWAYAEEPFRIVWAVRSDGVLLGFTYMREHDVFAWHRHTTGSGGGDGVVESVCSIPEPDGSGGLFDAIYLIVRRTINGQVRRYVERMAPRTWATISDMWFLDCALQYDGPPTTTISGLDHLEGKIVAILGDGSVAPSQTVTNGAVTLDGACSKVIVGLPYEADLETLNLELPAGGTWQGEMKKIAQVTLRVKESRGARVGLNQGAQAEVKQRSSEFLGAAMQLFSGDWNIVVPTEWNRDGRLFVKQTYPLPVTILDLIPEVNPGG